MIKPLNIEAKVIFTPQRSPEDTCILINEKGIIQYVGDKSNAPKNDYEKLSLPNYLISPGLIDIHVHGGYGISFGESKDLSADLDVYSNWCIKNGVTGYLLSISAGTRQETAAMIKNYVLVLEKGVSGARPLGLHLEGMFLNIERIGAFSPDWLRMPDLDEAKEYIDLSNGWVKQITMAPELPGALEVAREFAKAGITVALGHSNADYETARNALNGDFTHITHTFNALSGFSHRAPGVVGAILLSKNITCELIGDGFHVHPAAVELLIKCLGSDRVVLITDAIIGAGLPDDVYDTDGIHINVKDGKAVLDDGRLAGSAAVLNKCARKVLDFTGLDYSDVFQMASLNPARVIGLEKMYGSIVVGMPADLIVVDEDFNVLQTMVGGEILYSRLL